MSDRSVLVRLQANIQDFKAQMDQAARSVKGVGDQSKKTEIDAQTSLGRMVQSADKHEKAWTTAGTAMTAFGAATVVALGATVKAAMDWESAWAGVTKTLPDDADFEATEAGLRNLARTLPATHQEIAAVAEAAGQLGVAAEAIVPFTKTMIDLGETTNLSADEAATSIAQMMNVMRTAPEDVGRLGAALVELGNNGASTEADIMRLASYLTGSAQLIGATESDVLALANTMASLGINAERGGGVMSRTMQDIYNAVQNGGDALEGFAKVAGMSGAEFARAFGEDPIRAIGAFTDGLAKAKDRGENVVGILSDLGIKGTQDTAVLLQMAGAQGMLNEDLDRGAKAWSDNTALIEEANKRYDTTAAKMAIARNNMNDAAIEIGETFLPVLASLAEHLAAVAGWFADLPDPIQGAIGGLAGVAGVAGLAGGAFLLLFPRVIELRRAFQTLRTDMPGVASGLGKVGKAAGIAGTIIATTMAMKGLFEALEQGPATMEETTKALLALKNGTADYRALFDGLNIDKTWEQFDRIGESLAMMVANGNVDLAAESFNRLSAQWVAGGGDAQALLDKMPAYKEALAGLDNEQETAAESARKQANETVLLARDLDTAYSSLEAYAAALGMDEDATKKLIEASNELGSSLADFINPLGVYTTMMDEKAAKEEEAARKSAEAAGKGADAWRNFVKDTGFSFDEYMRRLEEQVAAQDNWQLNMLRLAGRVSAGTLAELSRMGPEGAPLVAELVKRSDAELDKFDDIASKRSQEATNAWGAQLTLAQPILAQLGAALGQGVVDDLSAKLMAGTTTVADIAKFFGIGLADGVNPLLSALGKPVVTMPGLGSGVRTPGQGIAWEADGGVLDFYADGGMENHTAQIAPAGAWRVWAEPETGGEAYIPLSPAKRDRSVDIWRKVGDRLGVQFAEFANGGFSSVNDVPRPPSTAPFQMPLSTAGDTVMQRAYDDTVAWLKENLAPVLGPGIGYEAMFAAVQKQFPNVRLHSGFRPGSITATGNLSYHASGRAIDITPDMAIFDWIAQNYGTQSRELIFSPANGRQMWNGRPHMYSEPTRGDHWDHIHWAMARGGILDFFKKGGPFNPHVRDAGGPLLPGFTLNGTGRNETVVPDHVVDGRLVSALAAAAPRQGPAQFFGDLYLDSGEFLGKVRGVAADVMDARDAAGTRDSRSWGSN